MKKTNFSDLQGFTIEKITGMDIDSEKITFETTSGRIFNMYHEQDCCEDVHVNDVCGACPNDHVGKEVLHASETTSDSLSDSTSSTWTFYNFVTAAGATTIRWLGTSNGNYSESVYFKEM